MTASIHSIAVVDLGKLGICECGFIAVERCEGCEEIVCETHSRLLPAVPDGVSGYAAGQFSKAVRCVDGVRCVSCRAELGGLALERAMSEPREPLPDHWLDRAIALVRDDTRSAEEKRLDGELPSTLTVAAVVDEFLRRITTAPRERAPVTPSRLLRGPEYVEGWRVVCRRTEYTQIAPGRSARYALPLLISVDGEALGPSLEAGDRPSATWLPVPESDVDLQRMVAGVAHILLLSRLTQRSAPMAK